MLAAALKHRSAAAVLCDTSRATNKLLEKRAALLQQESTSARNDLLSLLAPADVDEDGEGIALTTRHAATQPIAAIGQHGMWVGGGEACGGAHDRGRRDDRRLHQVE